MLLSVCCRCRLKSLCKNEKRGDVDLGEGCLVVPFEAAVSILMCKSQRRLERARIY